MTSPNGKLTAAELVTVAYDEQLSHPTANAYRALVAAAAGTGLKVALASPGAAYRSLFVQQDMHDHPARWDLNPASSVSLASAGHSTHGFGTRVDLLFDGSSNPTGAHLALAGRFGFTREFGSNDPNHFAHDGKTMVGGPGTQGHPAGSGVVTVKAGDTLSSIAGQVGATVAGLLRLNPTISDPDKISVGQQIRIR